MARAWAEDVVWTVARWEAVGWESVMGRGFLADSGGEELVREGGA